MCFQTYFFNLLPNLWKTHISTNIWLVLSDEQMSKGCPFSLLNDEQMSNWLGVEHQPDIFQLKPPPIRDFILASQINYQVQTGKRM